MKYGIMSSQVELLIPQGADSERLINHLATYSYSDLISEISSLGFNTIELSGDLELLLPHLYLPDSIDELKSLKSELGLTYTVHLPLWSLEPSTPLDQVREGSIQALINHVQAVSPLEPEVYILHATGALAAEFYRMNLPPTAKGYLLDQFQNNAKESINVLLSETGIPKAKLAIETIEFPLDRTLSIADELDISICFDTGHMLAGFSGNIHFFEALELCLPKLGEVHLHDCPAQEESKIGYGLDHQPLGNGDLDVKGFLDCLNLSNFEGPVIFELNLEEALKSIEFIKKINF